MIKTKQLLLLSTLAVMASAASAQSSDSETGTLYINGSIAPQTCAIAVDDVTVNLPEVSVSAFNDVDGGVGTTPFTITATCSSPLSSKPEAMTLAFTPAAETLHSSFMLRNLSEGSDDGASGVGVRLKAIDETVIDLDKVAGSQGFNSTAEPSGSGTYEWSFAGAEYYATGAGTVTPGTVTARSLFTVSYQ